MSEDRFTRRTRWIWLVIMAGLIAVTALELLGFRPK
ncbi:hypothetical protein FHS44_001754 [Streptosporangium saharense]|uniref:Uncharacterized protein n=1 Tax=Streptosporangium saharense TaxID=1706840 RepID=A0A7W7VLH2_9ACTN|nr:hypothetical protein [Streptosporangium saharense]